MTKTVYWASCKVPIILSKELGVLILTVEHNYICLWYYRMVITTTCFGPHIGPKYVVVITLL